MSEAKTGDGTYDAPGVAHLLVSYCFKLQAACCYEYINIITFFNRIIIFHHQCTTYEGFNHHNISLSLVLFETSVE